MNYLPLPKSGEFVTNKQFRIVFSTSHGRIFLVTIIIDPFAQQIGLSNDQIMKRCSSIINSIIIDDFDMKY